MNDCQPDRPRPFDRAQLDQIGADVAAGKHPSLDVVARLVATARATAEALDQAVRRCERLQAANRELVRRWADSAVDGAAEVLAAEVLMQVGLWSATGIEVHPGSTGAARLRDPPPWPPAWVAVLPDHHLVADTVDDHLALIGPPRERFAELRSDTAAVDDPGMGR